MKTMTKRGLTPVQIIGIALILLAATGIAAYLATKEPETLQEISGTAPVITQSPVAEVIAEYDRTYDSDEYCYDDAYALKCEDRCGGIEIKPHGETYADCEAPRRCCLYELDEEALEKEEPRLTETGLEILERRCETERKGRVCTDDEYCSGDTVQVDALECCLAKCAPMEVEK